MPLRGLILAAVYVSIALAFTPLGASAQTCQLFVPIAPDEPTMAGFVNQQNPYCDVTADGTYMKQWYSVRLDSRATAHGQCLNQSYDCVFIRLEERDVNHNDTIADIRPDGYKPLVRGYYSPVFPLVGSGLHELDSRNPDTTAAPTGILTTIGSWTLNFQSVQNRTNCAIEPFFGPLVQRTIHVVGCLPKFWGDNPIERVRPGAVSIYIPPTLQGTPVDLAAGRARDAWNTKLANYGQPVTFSVTYFPCSGAGCINVDTGPPPPSQPTNCAEPEPPGIYGPDGSWNAPATIRIRDEWQQWNNQSFLDWLLAHELTHTLGLHDNPDCPLTKSLVGPFNSCGQDMTNTGPTVNDALPVAKTTYNPAGSTLVCR